MKLLVYGAGVIGCELAHVLKKGGNDVTLLARGNWKDILEKRGLVIRHYLQRKTTTPVWDSLRKRMPVKEKRGCHEKIKNAYKGLGGGRADYAGV